MSTSQQADIMIIKIVKRHIQGDSDSSVGGQIHICSVFVLFFFCLLILQNTGVLHALFDLKRYMKMEGQGWRGGR